MDLEVKEKTIIMPYSEYIKLEEDRAKFDDEKVKYESGLVQVKCSPHGKFYYFKPLDEVQNEIISVLVRKEVNKTLEEERKCLNEDRELLVDQRRRIAKNLCNIKYRELKQMKREGRMHYNADIIINRFIGHD